MELSVIFQNGSQDSWCGVSEIYTDTDPNDRKIWTVRFEDEEVIVLRSVKYFSIKKEN